MMEDGSAVEDAAECDTRLTRHRHKRILFLP